MNSKRVRVLVVDDSRLLRTIIGDHVQASADFELVGTAANGREAIDRVVELRPDVVTLDVEMPGMNGLDALAEIMRRHPVPVIMVSALTTRAARITLDALDRGAVDFIPKPDRSQQPDQDFGTTLRSKIRMAAAVNLMRTAGRRPPSLAKSASPSPLPPAKHAVNCIAIGISTGGPPALAGLFAQLTPPLPPIVVVQHMPAQFTGPFAARLNGLSQLSIREAQSGDRLEVNHVLIAPGGKHLTIHRRDNCATAIVRQGTPVSGHMPSVDVMMKSAAQIFGAKCLGVIMTGMGSDGADGCRAIKQHGGHVLGQDAATSAVYGMNKVAFDQGHVDEQFTLADAAEFIQRHARSLAALRV